MLKVKLSKLSKKFVEKLPFKHKRQILEKTLSLAKDPLPPDSKPLKGFLGFFRTDIGEYRIIYKIFEPDVIIYLIGKRNDDEVYRKFKRLFN